MKKTIAFMLALMMALPLTACHKHTPGPEATCTEPQVCLECGDVLAEPLGHEEGPEATCSEPQTCTRCGEILAEKLPHTPGPNATCTEPQVCLVCEEVLAEAKGHNVGEDGRCSNCGEQIVAPGEKYIAPGKGNYTSENTTGLIPETVNSGHYNNNIDAFYSGTVLICGDYGMEYFSLDSSGSSSYADVVNGFARKYPNINVSSLLVPKCCVFECPSGYDNPHDNIKSFIQSTYDMMDSNVTKVDAFSIMDQHAGEYMWYRTDHHWTSLGAYYASVAYCNANGITPRALDSYESVIRTNVTGTLYMYSNNCGYLKQNPDYTVCRFPAVGYTMRCLNGGWYNGVAVNGDNHDYSFVFINGDNPLTVIKTDNKNGKTLIVFKESYGNAFVPYMIDYYEQIVVVDIRSDTESVASLISQYNVTDALIINNVQGAYSWVGLIRDKTMS